MDSSSARSQQLVAFVFRHRAWMACLALAIAVVAGHRTVRTYANLRSDIEELLPESAPSVAALAKLRERMPGLRHLGVVVDTGGPQNVRAAERFVDALAARIETYPPDLVQAVRTDVVAERRFAETYALQLMDPEDVRRLREAAEERREREVSQAMDLGLEDEDEAASPPLPLDELRRKYEKRFGGAGSLSSERFVSGDGRTVVLLVQASSHATGYESDKALLSKVQADIAALGFPSAFAADLRVGFAGDVATRVEEMEGLAADLSLSGALVLVLVVGSIVVFFRSALAVVVLGVPLALGTFLAFALSALPPLSIRSLNSNTAFLASIIIGNGINPGIILLGRYAEERHRGADVQRAIATALGETWRPTLAASLAASAAYGSLVFTDFRGFNQFGWIGGIGMVTCWACMMGFLPAVLAWTNGGRLREAARRRSEKSWWERLTAFLLVRPRSVVVVTALLLTGAIAGLAHRSSDWIEYDLSKLRRRDSWENGERYWGQRMDQTLGRYLTPTVVLADTPEQARRVEVRLRTIMEEGRAGGLIASVRSLATVYPETRHAALKEAEQLAEVLTPGLRARLNPEHRRLVERALSPEALQPLRAEQLPDVLVAGLREHGGRADRNVLVFPKLSGGTWDAQRITVFADDVRAAAASEGASVMAAGSLLLASDIAKAMVSDGPRATALALAVVIVICALAFRSLGLSVAAITSLGTGVVLMLGAMAWTGERLNFSNFVALPITFGVGADYAINMLKRYQLGKAGSLDAALASTGGAVVLCSATTIIGFGSLLVAQNRALFSFGLFAVTGELTCLVAAVVFLPAVLSWFEARSRRGAASPSPDYAAKIS